MYDLELRLKDRFPAKNKEEAKKEMVKRLHCIFANYDIYYIKCEHCGQLHELKLEYVANEIKG